MRPIVIGILVVTALCGQSARDPGPAVGSRVPDFTAVDQDGRPRSLHSLMGPKGLMLVFFRSADWWPYCKGQLVELQQNLEKTRRRGLGVAAISYDTVGVLRTFAQRKGISYPLLSDADSKVIRAYALLNETVPPGLPQFGIPFPGTFILDAFGLVVSKYFESDFRQRYTASERQYGERPGSTSQTVETKHLNLVSSASQTNVRWGERIRLTVDIDLKGGMHVYAPGVDGYIPIDWKIISAPAFTPHEVAYPASQQLYLKPIHESRYIKDASGWFRRLRSERTKRSSRC